MIGKFLLDTNIIIAIFAEDLLVERFLTGVSEVFIPCIALGELYYGARKSSNVKANVEKINDFSANTAILPCDSKTSWYYGIIKTVLKTKGRPIPENDIWIAAIAQQYGLTLVSRDEHFNEIEELVVKKF